MEIPRHWRLKAQRYRLQGSLCPICGQPTFPPRPVCPHCMVQAENLADERIRLRARTFTMVELVPRIRYPVTKSMIG